MRSIDPIIVATAHDCIGEVSYDFAVGRGVKVN